MILTFAVTLKQPTDATITDCKKYIQQSLETWMNQTRPPGAYGDDDPGDPMHFLEQASIRVKMQSKSPNKVRLKK